MGQHRGWVGVTLEDAVADRMKEAYLIFSQDLWLVAWWPQERGRGPLSAASFLPSPEICLQSSKL